MFLVSRTEARAIVQVLTGKQPSFGDEGKIIGGIARPAYPPDLNERISGDVWDLICRYRPASLDERPDPDTVINALDDAGDTVELWRGLEEAELICFLNGCRDGPNRYQDVKAKAYWFVDVLGSVRKFGN